MISPLAWSYESSPASEPMLKLGFIVISCELPEPKSLTLGAEIKMRKLRTSTDLFRVRKWSDTN